MAIVDFTDLIRHAHDGHYRLAVISVRSLAIVDAALQCASALEAPLVLAIDGDDLAHTLMPSVETLARRSPSPVALIARVIKNHEQAVTAIRYGCNALLPADNLSAQQRSGIEEMAASCGIPVIDSGAVSADLVDMTRSLEFNELLSTTDRPVTWQELHDSVGKAASSLIRETLSRSGAAGQGQHALAGCAPWEPVEHLIIYNTTTDDSGARALAAEGRRILDKIPGVRATWSGCSVRQDASYRWCWLIRFAHTAVIDSYREHPDHVRYADNHFRPVAGNRISIDYQLTGAE